MNKEPSTSMGHWIELEIVIPSGELHEPILSFLFELGSI